MEVMTSHEHHARRGEQPNAAKRGTMQPAAIDLFTEHEFAGLCECTSHKEG